MQALADLFSNAFQDKTVWQEEFFEHVLRSNDSLVDRVEYVCQNPVRAGIVKTESGYPWIWKGKVPVL